MLGATLAALGQVHERLDRMEAANDVMLTTAIEVVHETRQAVNQGREEINGLSKSTKRSLGHLYEGQCMIGGKVRNLRQRSDKQGRRLDKMER